MRWYSITVTGWYSITFTELYSNPAVHSSLLWYRMVQPAWLWYRMVQQPGCDFKISLVGQSELVWSLVVTNLYLAQLYSTHYDSMSYLS
jgi:hypothetical protein